MSFFKPKRIIDTPTIKWMRNRVRPEEVNASLTTLLLEKEKCQPLFLRIITNKEFLKSFDINEEESLRKKSLVHLKPEMFFNQTILEKVYHMRDIFLEFDEDRSRTLEINELFTMFNSHNIPITEEELMELFGKGKKKKYSDYRITFLEFVMFSLSHNYDDLFRNIMKRVKLRASKETFIPLDFNQALEFMYNKGKMNDGLKKIQKGVMNIEKVNKKLKQENNSNYEWTLGNTKNILRKCGIGRSVNVNQVCKGFNDVINASKYSINKFVELPNTRVTQINEEKIKEIITAFNIKNTITTKYRNKSTIDTECSNSKNVLPLINTKVFDSNVKSNSNFSLSKSYRKPNIQYLHPNITNSNETCTTVSNMSPNNTLW